MDQCEKVCWDENVEKFLRYYRTEKFTRAMRFPNINIILFKLNTLLLREVIICGSMNAIYSLQIRRSPPSTCIQRSATVSMNILYFQFPFIVRVFSCHPRWRVKSSVLLMVGLLSAFARQDHLTCRIWGEAYDVWSETLHLLHSSLSQLVFLFKFFFVLVLFLFDSIAFSVALALSFE